MDKNKINQYRQFVSVALQSAKIYVDMGGDACGVNVLGALFKWPDVIYDLLNLMDGKDSEETFIKDVGAIMLDPIAALGLAYLDSTELSSKEKEAYKVVLRSRTINNMSDILKHRDMIVNMLVKLVTLKEKQNAGRNCERVEENGV